MRRPKNTGAAFSERNPPLDQVGPQIGDFRFGRWHARADLLQHRDQLLPCGSVAFVMSALLVRP